MNSISIWSQRDEFKCGDGAAPTLQRATWRRQNQHYDKLVPCRCPWPARAAQRLVEAKLMPARCASGWADLPSDLLCRLFEIISKKDRLTAEGVCRHWRALLARPKVAGIATRLELISRSLCFLERAVCNLTDSQPETPNCWQVSAGSARLHLLNTPVNNSSLL